MSSLSFSLAISTPNKHIQNTNTNTNTNTNSSSPYYYLSPRIVATTTNTNTHNPQIQTQTPNDIQKTPNLWTKRDVICGGITTLVGTSVLQPDLATGATQTQQQESESASVPDFVVSPSGLAFFDKLVGNGPPPAKGQLIKAHYIGELENGKVFDSSYNRGKPLAFRVGVGEVIKGWDQGILGTEGVPPMLPGGKRRLRIPPELGYGMRGAGCKGGSCLIPPDSVLYFNVEFVGKV